MGQIEKFSAMNNEIPKNIMLEMSIYFGSNITPISQAPFNPFFIFFGGQLVVQSYFNRNIFKIFKSKYFSEFLTKLESEILMSTIILERKLI